MHSEADPEEVLKIAEELTQLRYERRRAMAEFDAKIASALQRLRVIMTGASEAPATTAPPIRLTPLLAELASVMPIGVPMQFQVVLAAVARHPSRDRAKFTQAVRQRMTVLAKNGVVQKTGQPGEYVRVAEYVEK